ncbi:unnamed protein product [Ectocarpus sp. CCAP 1310/34]|nr:unnamed protein product [Ectocarpus sp. CCAP 1310/34]
MWEKYWTEMEYGHLREKNDAPAGAMAAGRTTAGAAGGAGLGTQRVSMKNDGNCALSGYSSSRNPPKIPTNSTKAVSWLRRMRNFLAVEDLERTLDHMPSTGYVNVISCLDRTYLNQTHGAHLVAAHQRAWGYMLEATCGTDIEERLGACDCVPEAWSVIHEWLLPTLDAEKTLLVRRLETIEMHPGEDPKLFFARVDGVINIMKAVGIEKSERAIVHIIVRQLAHEYDIERKSILADPTISRAKVENVVRAAYANKVMMKELGKAQAAPAAAVTVGGLGSGHGGHGQGGLQRRWRQQRQHQQWVRPQPPPAHYPPPNFPTWGSGGLYDCGRNAVYPQEESASPQGALIGVVHQCVRCGRHGHSLGDCNAPRRFEGNCTACGEYGHRRRMCCTIDRMQQHVPVGDGEGLNANGNDAMPHQQRKRRRWRRQRHRQEALLPVFAAGAVAWGTVPAAGAATVDGGFPTTVAGGTVGGQALAAGAAASTAAPAARAATPGSRIFPAAAAGETAGAQALAAGATAWTAAPAARAATAGSRVLPAAAVWEPVGTQAIAAKASAAQEPEDECDEDSCWLGHGDEGGNSSDGSGDGGIGALSAGARHPGAHPTVSNGIYVVRDDGG